MAEVSDLKLKLTSVEKDQIGYEDRFRDTEVRGQNRLAKIETFLSSYFFV